MLLGQGQRNGCRIYSEGFVEAMVSNQLESIGDVSGLGWAMGKQYMGTLPEITRLGRNGFTGCMVLFDLKMQRAVAFLCNRTYPKRQADSEAVTVVHADIADIVFSSLVEPYRR
jgi:CubicO group peptidase (beta-lactamase class C family)